VNALLPDPFHLIDLDTVESTNDEALVRACDGAPAWTVIRSVAQSAGRGRRGKSFASPPGNSYTSFVVRPTRTIADVAQVALVAGLALAEAVDAAAPGQPPATCKWPNDVLVGGCKVAGILVESSVLQGRLEALVIGIGVNLVSHPVIPGLNIGDLKALTGHTVGRDRFLEILAGCLLARFETWDREGFGCLHEMWSRRAAGIGQKVTVDAASPVHGILRGIDEAGHLLIDDASGVRHRCVSGSLVLEEAS